MRDEGTPPVTDYLALAETLEQWGSQSHEALSREADLRSAAAALREAHAEIEREQANVKAISGEADALRQDLRAIRAQQREDFARAEAAEKKLEAVRELASPGCTCEDCTDYAGTVRRILDQQEDTE